MTEGSVTSRDGTTIAFERTGSGRPLILVGSALADRSDAAKLAALLAPDFTVVNYDRRGRGKSGDTQPYGVGRECEDIEALVKEVGGSASLFGSSSGAALALAAAASGVGVDALALFEPPFVVQEGDRRPPADLGSRVDELVATGRPGKAVNAFMTEAIGMPAIAVRLMRLMPRTWAKLEAMAPTIRYDLTIMAGTQDGGALPRERWASVAAPTLVLDGGKSPAGMRHAASALADVLPNARHRTVEGVSHGAVVMAPKKLAPLLREFFRA